MDEAPQAEAANSEAAKSPAREGCTLWPWEADDCADKVAPIMPCEAAVTIGAGAAELDDEASRAAEAGWPPLTGETTMLGAPSVAP